jgi:hypothetical protein
MTVDGWAVIVVGGRPGRVIMRSTDIVTEYVLAAEYKRPGTGWINPRNALRPTHVSVASERFGIH